MTNESIKKAVLDNLKQNIRKEIKDQKKAYHIIDLVDLAIQKTAEDIFEEIEKGLFGKYCYVEGQGRIRTRDARDWVNKVKARFLV